MSENINGRVTAFPCSGPDNGFQNPTTVTIDSDDQGKRHIGCPHALTTTTKDGFRIVLCNPYKTRFNNNNLHLNANFTRAEFLRFNLAEHSVALCPHVHTK